MRIGVTGLLWQLFILVVLYGISHYSIKLLKNNITSLGPSERLFPRKILRNDKALNEHRSGIAEEIIRKYEKPNFKNVEVEVRVVASNRGGTYLLQTIAFLLEQQTKGIIYNMSICNVESEKFKELDKFAFLPLTTVGSSSQKSDSMNFTIGKENLDYWKCLNLTTSARYVLLVEDDAVVITEFYNLLKSLVSHLDYHPTVDYVKLYHPNYLRKIPSLFLKIAFAILFSFILCQIFHKSYSLLTFVLLAAAISINLTYYSVTFPSEVRYQLTGSAYISYPESCCTPAVIFRSDRIPQMTSYFLNSSGFEGHAKDHILDESPFTGRQSDINYVTHIGSFSSIRHRTVFLSDIKDLL